MTEEEKENYVISTDVLKICDDLRSKVVLWFQQRQQQIDELEKKIENAEVDLEDYCEINIQGIDDIHMDAKNLLDKQAIETFGELITKHGTKKVLGWLEAIKAKFGA